MGTATGHRDGARTAIALAIAIAAVLLGMSGPSAPNAIADSDTRALTPAQKKAKAKALTNCRKIKAKAKRTACIKKVNRKYSSGSNPAPIGRTWEVGVWDNYYMPGTLEIGLNDAVEWVWEEDSREGHNVSLLEGPRGVSPYDFESRIIYSAGSTFKRQFKVAGSYSFFCSLHAGMEMQVDVRN